MRIDRERLIFLALAVLHRAALDTRQLPAEPDLGVRLALALLFGFGGSGDRTHYDGFWRALRDPYLEETSDTMRGIRRKQEVFGCLTMITRDLGVPERGAYQERISNLVIGPPKHPWRPGAAYGHAIGNEAAGSEVG